MRLEASSIGVAVADFLDRPGPATVLAAFEQSFYLDLDSVVIAVAAGDLHDGPLNLLVKREPAVPCFADLGVHVGQSWTLTGDRRLCRDGLTIDAGKAAVWAPGDAGRRIERGRIEAGLAVIRRLAAGRRSADGLCRLAMDADAAPVTAIERAAMSLLSVLRRDLAIGRVDAAFDLLGLGPGLTPSGDDLLAGIFLTWHRIGEKKAERLARTVLRDAKDRTNPISFAHLQLAATEGLGAAPIHDLLDAVIDGCSRDIAEALDAVSRIGHCSGWDAVGGIILALTAWLDLEADRQAAA